MRNVIGREHTDECQSWQTLFYRAILLFITARAGVQDTLTYQRASSVRNLSGAHMIYGHAKLGLRMQETSISGAYKQNLA